MKAREPRQAVLLPVRIRAGLEWSDACVTNLSSRGLGLTSATPPSKGSYVELCRGEVTVVARVAWTRGRSFGVQLRERIDIRAAAIERGQCELREPELALQIREERRSRERLTEEAAERSRFAARALQMVSIAMVAATAAIGLATMVEDALAQPLQAIGGALAEGD